MQLVLSFERTRCVTRPTDWVVGTDKIGRGSEYDQRAKGGEMHDFRSFCGEKVCANESIQAASDSIYTFSTSRGKPIALGRPPRGMGL